MRWVITETGQDKNKKIKTRLVARGFEEDSNFQVDSPTAQKASIKLFLVILCWKNWVPNVIDIQTAFLQGKSIDRDVFLRPPTEFREKHTLWKLKKCVYGLQDASRRWYFTVRDFLLEIGCCQSKCDLSIFTYYEDENFAGIIIIHVDDFAWGGTEAFESKIICRLQEKFLFGKTATVEFTFLGLNVQYSPQHIFIDQRTYWQSITKNRCSKGTLVIEKK